MKFVVELLTAKPSYGFMASMGGGVAGLLTALKVITPIFGFVSVLIGIAVGIVTLMIKLREWKRNR